MSHQKLVNLAVCGKFHILNYVLHIAQRGALSRLFMSHKNATCKRLGLPDDEVRNFPAKEFLIQGHGRLPGRPFYDSANTLYHWIWETQVLRNWQSAPVLHLLAQGAGNRLVARAHKEGSQFLCDVVNTHPHNRLELMQIEADRWKLKPWRNKLLRREELLLEEVAQADTLLAPSRHVAETFRARGVKVPIHVLPYAANIALFNPAIHLAQIQHRAANMPLRIISIGQIGLRKGQLHLLRMLDIFNTAIEITLVGAIDPEILPLLVQYAGRFRHFVRVPHNEMAALLAQHDVYVSTAVEEGLAVSICEAMAMGLAIIATNESGAEEIIDHGDSGLLFRAADHAALADSLERMIGDRDLVRNLAAAAGARSRNVMSWERYADRLVSIYIDLQLTNLARNRAEVR